MAARLAVLAALLIVLLKFIVAAWQGTITESVYTV